MDTKHMVVKLGHIVCSEAATTLWTCQGLEAMNLNGVSSEGSKSYKLSTIMITGLDITMKDSSMFWDNFFSFSFFGCSDNLISDNDSNFLGFSY